jgi:hypothetical protein
MVSALFLTDELVKVTLETIAQLACKAALQLTSAQRTCDRPARPPSSSSTVDAIGSALNGCLAHAQFCFSGSTGLSATLLELPTIELCHMLLPV